MPQAVVFRLASVLAQEFKRADYPDWELYFLWPISFCGEYEGGSMNVLPAIINTCNGSNGSSEKIDESWNGRIGEGNGDWRGRYLIDFPGGMEGQKRSVVPGIRNNQNSEKMLQFDPVDPRVEAAA